MITVSCEFISTASDDKEGPIWWYSKEELLFLVGVVGVDGESANLADQSHGFGFGDWGADCPCPVDPSDCRRCALVLLII